MSLLAHERQAEEMKVEELDMSTLKDQAEEKREQKEEHGKHP